MSSWNWIEAECPQCGKIVKARPDLSYYRAHGFWGPEYCTYTGPDLTKAVPRR